MEEQGINKVAYSMGQRDALALLLMEKKYEGIKDQLLAKTYKEYFGEHPTLSWHLEKES